MHKMKKTLAVSMAAMMVALMGCGGNTPDSGLTNPDPQPVPGVDSNVNNQPNNPDDQTNNPPAPNENRPNQDTIRDFSVYKDPDATVLSDSLDTSYEVPSLTIVGDKWPCDESKLQDSWNYYFGYMNVVYGPIANDFYTQGLTWMMTDETLANRVNEQFPIDNHIEMGIPVASENETDCINGLIHETGHIWLQNNDLGIQFDCGQWLWEAHTILFERLLIAEGFIDGYLANCYDLYEYVGPDKLNGVMLDGYKAVRSNSDFSASCALFYLDTVLSTPGTYDYWQKVSIARVNYCIENNCSSTNPEVLGKIMDDVAEGKTIDGMKPSEWLFSRAVSNTNAPDGTYVATFGNYGDSLGDDLRFNVYGFTRTNGVETGLEGKEVTVQLFDASGNEKASDTFVFDEWGYVDKRGLPNVPRDEFPDYSAVRFVSTVNIDGQEITGTNYTILTSRDDIITATDNRIFFILINGDETINTTLTDVDVEGAYNVETEYLANGLLVVQVEQGQSVTLFGKTYSKPLGSRIIPIVVEN